MNKNTNIKDNYFLADWLEGKLSDQELKKLVSEQDYKEYLKLRSSFDLLSELNNPLDDTLAKIKRKINHTPKKEKKVIPLFAKFTLGIAASLLLFFGLYSKFANQEVIYTTTDNMQTIALLDGSEVILNSNSTLKYNKKIWQNKRELQLDGEAYFKVTKGDKFTVVTKNGSVSVLGTHFNVNSRNDFFKVFCFEGKVKVVTKKHTEHILTPNKGVVVIGNSEREIIRKQNNPSWLKGTRTFEKTPLNEVITELENQFNITIDKNNVNDTILFSGGFSNNNLNKALQSVFKPLQIKYTVKGNTVILKQFNANE